jgi:glycosyltransferase involved in cell wall biosynthesis
LWSVTWKTVSVIHQLFPVGRPDIHSAASITLNRPLDPPLVSVVIASYGRGHLVGRAVRSALAQTHQNVEVVVSDDASPDDTLAVLAAITDPRLRVNAQPANVGVWENWTAALRMARGEYVVFLGDDDHLTPNFVECHLTAFRKHPRVDLVLCSIQDVLLDGQLLGRLPPPFLDGKEAGPMEFLRASLRPDFSGAGMFRRDLAARAWEDTRPDGIVADRGLILRSGLTHGIWAASCDECTYFKTIHSNRLSSRVVEVTRLLAEFYERMSSLAEPVNPAIASELLVCAAMERITLARHHAAANAMDLCRRELRRSSSLHPGCLIVWSQLAQAYLWPSRMVRTSKSQRG